MARIVMKFGGTSVANVERIKSVAQRVKAEVDAGNEVGLVVSAMSGVTNELVGYVRDTSRFYDTREYDTVVSAGEQITCGLAAIALQEVGVSARSWLGWQVPIRTDDAHGSARIESIEGEEIVRRMGEGQVAVFAGFQGVDANNRIATLGRGGSDTSAVAIAAALGAERCDIYTDVDGIYTTDPRIGGVDAVDVGVDVAAFGAQGGGDRHRRGVRAAAAQGRDPVVRVDALEAREHGDLPLAHPADDLLALDALDARAAVGVVGADRDLPAQPGTRGDADLLQRDRRQPAGDLLAGGDHRVVLPGVVEPRGVADVADQFVGDAGHRGDHQADLVAGVDLRLDPLGDALDALDVGDRGAAELHHDAGHGRSGPWVDVRAVARRTAATHTLSVLSRARNRAPKARLWPTARHPHPTL